MKNPQTIKIRIYIMMIAILGGLGFLGFLMFSILLANDHEERIAELHQVKFPVIEQLSSLKRDLSEVHDAISTALALEHDFLLEESYDFIEQFSARLVKINQLDPSTAPLTHELNKKFQQYHVEAKAIADILIKNPEQSRKYEDKTLKVNLLRHELTYEMDHILVERKQEYVEVLGNTNQAMKSHNRRATALGIMLIASLVVLAWLISVIVIKAVNRSDKLKEIFLATMSHELRTPMNGISGAIALLKDTDPTPKQQTLLEACRASELTITTAIDDILEFSGLMSGRIKVINKPFPFNVALNNIIALFKNDYEVKGIRIKIDNQMPNCDLISDEQRISHVLRHLIGNAIKFSEQGDINISLRCTEEANNTHLVSVRIVDTGPGIPEEKLGDVMKPFQQIDGSFKRQHQGMGIGLPMSQGIARALGGGIILMNYPTGGLDALFTFKVELSDATEEEKSQAEIKQAVSAQDHKILIVEDNKVNQMVLKGFLKKLGFESDCAANGQEGLDMAKSKDYAMIMMDCQMPIMDGFESTQKIRQLDGPRSSTPIIAVTANAMSGDRERCLDCGMNDYLKKPVDIDDLQQAMAPYFSSPPLTK